VFCEGDTGNITEHLYDNKALDNATLKLQHHGVGRPLAHKKDKRCVFGTRGQGQQSILVMKKVFGQGLLYSCKVRPLKVDAAARQRSPSHTARSN